MRKLSKWKEFCFEQGEKKSAEVMAECFKRLRFLRKHGGVGARFSVTGIDKKSEKKRTKERKL